MNRKLLFLTVALLLVGCVANRPPAHHLTPAEQLGWQMAIHERTFDRYTVYECMDKTAALGLRYMSLSGSVKLDAKTTIPTSKLTDEQIADIKEHLKAKGLTLVNAYVSLPANEAQCRREFEFARKM